MIQTFEQWEEQAETKWQKHWMTGGTQKERCCFDMLGFEVLQLTIFPWNVFQDIGNYMEPVLTVQKNSDTARLAEKHGGKWVEHPYPGFEDMQGNVISPFDGTVMFHDEECAQQCWNFLTDYIELNKVK